MENNNFNTGLIAKLVEIDMVPENPLYMKHVDENGVYDYVDGKLLPCCPHCGESYYMEKYSSTTAVYYPPIYKDGVNINPDRNKTTTHCTCMNCGKDFSFMR